MPTTRERIIEASATLFMRQGYAGSGLKQISNDSAAPFGSVYHHFPGGKEELAGEALRWAGHQYQQLVEAVFDSSPDIVSGVRNCFAGAGETLRATGYADACPIATVALEVASSNDALRRVTAEIFESWLEAATVRLVAAGIDESRARRLATTLVAALEGGFLLSRAARDTAAMDAIGEAMVALVEDALAPTRHVTPLSRGEHDNPV